MNGFAVTERVVSYSVFSRGTNNYTLPGKLNAFGSDAMGLLDYYSTPIQYRSPLVIPEV